MADMYQVYLLMVEQILASYHRAYGLDYVAFRYFNACGADSLGRHGQEPGATHIIARVLESIADGKDVYVRYVGEQHVKEDCNNYIPTAKEWVDMITSGKPKEWALKTLKIED